MQGTYFQNEILSVQSRAPCRRTPSYSVKTQQSEQALEGTTEPVELDEASSEARDGFWRIAEMKEVIVR